MARRYGSPDGPLEPYELASALSFFMSDGPPDAELLEAAASGKLSNSEQIGAQVTRLLATPTVRKNLETAMLAYFDIGKLAGVDIDTAKFPNFTPELQLAMYRETQLFLTDTLWNGSLSDLLTSQKTRVNAELAALYGIPFPQTAPADAEGFVQCAKRRILNIEIRSDLFPELFSEQCGHRIYVLIGREPH